MSNYSERRDDHCPACGEDIDWDDDWHWLMYDQNGFCNVEREWFGVKAAASRAHLND